MQGTIKYCSINT